MNSRAQGMMNQISSLTGEYGVTVNIARISESSSIKRNVFGKPIDDSGNAVIPQMFTASVIIESQKIDLVPTLAGGKAKEILKLITTAGSFLEADEFQYGSHTYKVNFIEPVPFAGSDVVNFVHAEREVD